MTPVLFDDCGETITLETGCFVAGHNGQYIPDELASVAEDFGWGADDPTHDPRIIRVFAEALGRNAGDLWGMHSECADSIIDWLNLRVEAGFAFGFDDGEVFLLSNSYWRGEDDE